MEKCVSARLGVLWMSGIPAEPRSRAEHFRMGEIKRREEKEEKKNRSRTPSCVVSITEDAHAFILITPAALFRCGMFRGF